MPFGSFASASLTFPVVAVSATMLVPLEVEVLVSVELVVELVLALFGELVSLDVDAVLEALAWFEAIWACAASLSR